MDKKEVNAGDTATENSALSHHAWMRDHPVLLDEAEVHHLELLLLPVPRVGLRGDKNGDCCTNKHERERQCVAIKVAWFLVLDLSLIHICFDWKIA